MPGPVVTMTSTITCTHGGQATCTMPSPRVVVLGAPAVTVGASYVVAGCPLVPPPLPPCGSGMWLVGALRVTTGGQPLALQAGSSVTLPAGTPMLPLVVQPRVVAT